MPLSNSETEVVQDEGFLLLFTLVGSIAAVNAAGASAAATVRGIVPFMASDNPRCCDLRGVSWSESVKFSPPVNGSSAGGVTLLVDGKIFQWYVVKRSAT